MACHLLAVAPLAGLQPRRVSISRRERSRAVAGRVVAGRAAFSLLFAASRAARRSAVRRRASASARGVSGRHSMSMNTSRLRRGDPKPGSPASFAGGLGFFPSTTPTTSTRSAPRRAPATRDWPSATSSSAGCSRIALPSRAASASETRHARIPSARSSTSCRSAAHIASTVAGPIRLYESSSRASPSRLRVSADERKSSSPPNACIVSSSRVSSPSSRSSPSYRRRFRSHASTARLPARARTTDATAASLASVNAHPLRSTSRSLSLRRTPSTSAEKDASPISESRNDTRRRLWLRAMAAPSRPIAPAPRSTPTSSSRSVFERATWSARRWPRSGRTSSWDRPAVGPPAALARAATEEAS